jgi:hypothetical protein
MDGITISILRFNGMKENQILSGCRRIANIKEKRKPAAMSSMAEILLRLLFLLPPSKEMMHRPMAVADLILGAGGDGPIHVSLGLLHGGLNVVTLG